MDIGKPIEVIFHGSPAELAAFQMVPFFDKWVKSIKPADVTDTGDADISTEDPEGDSSTTPSTTSAPAPWELSAHGCVMAGDCMQSLYHPADYGNHQESLVTLNDEVYFSVAAFNTESGFDFLKMNGTRYSGTSDPPNGTYSGTISWNPGFSVTSSGWKLCTSS